MLSLAACLGSTKVSQVDVAGSSVWVEAPNVAQGTDVGVVHVLLMDTAGSPIANAPILVVVDGCTVSPAQVQTNGQGRANAHAICARVGQYSVEAHTQFQDVDIPIVSNAALNVYAPLDGQRAVRAGMALNLQAVALDHNMVTRSYAGTVHVSSSDANATLPGDYTFTDADAGVKTWLNAVQLHSHGVQTVAVADRDSGAVLAEWSVTVSAGQPSSLLLQTDTAVIAGQPCAVQVSLFDDQGAAAVDFVGALQLTSTDRSAAEPTLLFGAADGGSISTTLVLGSVGVQYITVADANGKLTSTSQGILVSAAPASQLRVQLPGVALVGQALRGQVTVTDAYGNSAGDFDGPVVLQSSDPSATLPTNLMMTEGHLSLSNVMFTTSGNQSLTVRDANQRLQAGISMVAVQAGSAVQMQMQCPSSNVAGADESVVVSLRDAYGNLAAGYTGTVQFTSSDVAGVYPHARVFTSGDGGSYTFAAALNWHTAGSQSLYVEDITNGSLNASCSGINVAAGAAQSLFLSGPATAMAGSNITLSLAAQDAFGNLASAVGSAILSSSDLTAALPTTATIGSTPTAITPVQLRWAGTRTVTATDSAGILLPSSLSIEVTPNTQVYLALEQMPGHWPVGQQQYFEVHVYDSIGNPATNYTGSITVQTTDSFASGLPDTHTMVPQNSARFGESPTLQTLGYQTITATDGTLSVSAQVDVYKAGTPLGYSMQSLSANPSNGGTFGNSVHPTLALDSNGWPQVAWSDNRNAVYQILVRSWNGTAWNNLGSGSTSGAGITSSTVDCGSPAMAMGANNTPLIAWLPDSNIQALRFDGAIWNAMAGSHTAPGLGNANPQSCLAVAMGNTNVPHLAWCDANDGSIHVMRFSGGAWQGYGGTSLVSSLGDFDPDGIAMVLDSSGQPYVAWQAGSPDAEEIYMASWNGSAWAALAGSDGGGGISNNAGASHHPTLALDSANTPWVAWDDDTSGTWQVYLRTYRAGSWAETNGSATDGGISGSANGAGSPALAMSQSDVPNMVYQDWGIGKWAVYHKSYNGSAWVAHDDGASRWGISSQFNQDAINPQVALTSSGQAVITFESNQAVFLCVW